MDVDELSFDLIVVGAGMAGLGAAARAAEKGARVAVIEAAATHGGSALLSGGIFWGLETVRKMNYHVAGDEALAALVVEGYADAVAWMRKRGIAMSQALQPLNGRGYQIDIVDHLRQCLLTVEGADGIVVYETRVERLITDADGKVIGARTVHADGTVDLLAPWTLLATGGFQGSPDLRERYLHPNARAMRLRSNTVSDGAGLRLATSVGAHAPIGNRGFYGHLVSRSPAWGDPRLFTRLSQYHSDHCVMLDETGHRFCDETEGDHTNTHRTLSRPGARALLVWDETIHEAHATTPIVPVAPPEDRMQVALENGGEGIVAATLDEIGGFATAHGFNGDQTVETLRSYNRLAREGWECLDPPRAMQEHDALDRPPFYALIVYPAITFTFAGVAADDAMRALSDNGSPIPGLLVAGADAGNIHHIGYAGGLGSALVTGLRAARTAGFG